MVRREIKITELAIVSRRAWIKIEGDIGRANLPVLSNVLIDYIQKGHDELYLVLKEVRNIEPIARDHFKTWEKKGITIRFSKPSLFLIELIKKWNMEDWITSEEIAV